MHGKSVWVWSLRWGNARLERALPRPLFRGGVQTWRTQKEREWQGSPVWQGWAGRDRRRELPSPPMWERDGQAPERQEHGLTAQGCRMLESSGGWVPGYLDTWIPGASGGHVPSCWELYSTGHRVLAIVQVRLPTYRSTYPVSCLGRSVPLHQPRPTLGTQCNTWLVTFNSD